MTNQSTLTAPAPYSQEAEEAVIGGLLISPELYGIVSAVIQPSDFFIVRHGYIFEAMQRVVARRDVLDNVTVTAELHATGRYTDIGGQAYLARLIDGIGSSYNTDIYAALVKRLAVRRRMMSASDEMKALALNEEMPLEDVLANSERIMTNIRKGAGVSRGKPWKEIISGVYDTVADRLNGNVEAFGLPSGFKELDGLTTGFKKQSLTIVGGRPGMGKTSLILSMALYQALLGARVGFISLEMSAEELAERVLAMAARIDMQGIRTGEMPDGEWKRFTQAVGRISELPIEIADDSGMTVKMARAKALEWMNQGGLDVLYLDYLQILTPDAEYKGNRTQEVSAMARGLKDLARELKIPVLSAAQINRGVENRQDKKPTLADLRESGEIEQAADNVLFPYREDYYEGEKTGDTELILAKQRNGPTGSAWAKWIAESTLYIDGRQDRKDLLDLQGWGE